MKSQVLVLSALVVAFGQNPRIHTRPPFPDATEDGIRLPNGKSQREAILKDDYKKNLADATELAKLAEELKTDIEKNDRYIVSVKTLKKTEDIEKLVKNIRGRLKRY